MRSGRLLPDGKARTLITLVGFYRREFDTLLSPACCKAHGMAVSARSGRACAWNSGSLEMGLEESDVLRTIPIAWTNASGPSGDPRWRLFRSVVGYLRRSLAPRQRMDFSLAGLGNGW